MLVIFMSAQIDHLTDYFAQTNELARNILHLNIMYLTPSDDVKISTFLDENGG